MRPLFRRGFLTILLAAVLLLSAKAAPRRASVQINGTVLNAACYVDSGVTYVPLRTLLDALGGWTLQWDAGTKTAVADSSSARLIADPNTNTITLDGTPRSGRVTVENGRTYVPLRLVMEAMGAKVVWDKYFGGAAVTTADFPYDAVDLFWLARIIYAESGAESQKGQIAVGNVVLNRVASGKFPNTIPAVIFDRKDAVQFEPVENGSIYQTPPASAVASAKAALDGANTVGNALYFYAPALSQGIWINANCTYLQTIGCHRFYI